MKKITVSFFCTLIAVIVIAADTSKCTTKDFKKVMGSWQGSLTYLDYTSGKPFTMPSNLVVKKISKTNKLVFVNMYPTEPHANSNDTITISQAGNQLNNELIKSKTKLADGSTQIITEELALDGNDNKQATIRHTYTFSSTFFTIKKDVQFIGQIEWIERHTYTYKR